MPSEIRIYGCSPLLSRLASSSSRRKQESLDLLVVFTPEAQHERAPRTEVEAPNRLPHEREKGCEALRAVLRRIVGSKCFKTATITYTCK
jgi:hypothetical protein